jgi:hypothetical protein
VAPAVKAIAAPVERRKKIDGREEEFLQPRRNISECIISLNEDYEEVEDWHCEDEGNVELFRRKESFLKKRKRKLLSDHFLL